MAERAVDLDDGTTLTYQHLIVGSGATPAFFSVPGAAEHALCLYTLDDARGVRNTVLASLERADREHADSDPLVVVVGGGPTGVETTGALTELIDIAIRHDRLRLDRRPAGWCSSTLVTVCFRALPRGRAPMRKRRCALGESRFGSAPRSHRSHGPASLWPTEARSRPPL
jgi:cation diffusion facilitator CzcD-associated flavoprotein CzcO